METDTLLRLIREVQKRPILYDLKHPETRNYKLREQAWNEVSKYCGGTGDDKGGAAIKQKWRILRARYIRALKRKNSPSAEKNAVLFPYEFAMDFVKPYIIPALKSSSQWVKVQKIIRKPIILNGKNHLEFLKRKQSVNLAIEVADQQEIVEDSGHSSATLSVSCDDDSNQEPEQQELIDVYMEVLDDENIPPSKNFGASSPNTQKNVPSNPIKAKRKNFVDIHKLPKSLGIYKVTNISDSAKQIEIIKEASRNSPKINQKDVSKGVINLSFNDHIVKEEENRRRLQIDDNVSSEATTGDTEADKSTGNHTENNKETDKENVIERNSSPLNVIDLSTEEEIEIMAIEVMPKVASMPVNSNSRPDSALQNLPRKDLPVHERPTLPVNHEGILPCIRAKKRGIDGRFCECNRDASYDGEIDEFFRCISLSVCRLGPLISAKLKKDISNLVINAEISDLND